MQIKHRAHLSSITERLEIALIGTFIALLADTLEVGYNLSCGGWNSVHGGVLILLFIGLYMSISAVVKHHIINFKEIMADLKAVRAKRKKK